MLSKEVIQVAQLLGFDFRRAIGQPLTELISQLILKNVPSEDMKRLNLENIILTQKVALDETATKRLMKLLGRSDPS